MKRPGSAPNRHRFNTDTLSGFTAKYPYHRIIKDREIKQSPIPAFYQYIFNTLQTLLSFHRSAIPVYARCL